MTETDFVDVSATAAEVGAGFNLLKAPVAVTRNLWELCVKWDANDTDEQGFQEEGARLWDVLFVCGNTIALQIQRFLQTMSHKYSIDVVPRDGQSTEAVKANLEASGNLRQGWLVIDLIDLDYGESEE